MFWIEEKGGIKYLILSVTLILDFGNRNLRVKIHDERDEEWEMNSEAVSFKVISVLSFCGIGLGLGAAVFGISVLAVLGIFMLLSVLFLCFLYLRKRVNKVTWLFYYWNNWNC